MKKVFALIVAVLMAFAVMPVGAKTTDPLKGAVGTDLSAVHAPYLMAGGQSSTTDFLTAEDFASHALTVLTIWDSNCGYCKAEMPFLQRLHDEVPDLLVVGVCTQQTFLGGTYAAGWNYLQANGYTYLNVKPDSVLGGLFTYMDGVPYNFLVNSEGIVVKMIEGAMMNWNETCEEIGPVLAQYTDRQCTVSYVESVNGTVFATEQLTVGQVPTYSVTAPTIEGHTFQGFTPAAANPCPVLSDTVITANYIPRSMKVQFFDSITNTKIATKYTSWGNPVVPPAAPEHEGYTFVGWDHDLSCIKEKLDVYTVYYEGTPLPGDVDLDGQVSGTDALTVLRAAMELQVITDAEQNMGDINGDGVVDSSDALLILRASMGL